MKALTSPEVNRPAAHRPEGCRVALYARVSTVEHGQDVGLQLDELRQVAKQRGWLVFQEYVLLGELLSTATGADANARDLGYLGFRPDLAVNARWRLWLYYTRGTDGLEVAFSPDLTLSGLSMHVAEVFGMADLPVRSGLGLVSPAGQAAAAVGPKSIGSAELDDAAVSAASVGLPPGAGA